MFQFPEKYKNNLTLFLVIFLFILTFILGFILGEEKKNRELILEKNITLHELHTKIDSKEEKIPFYTILKNEKQIDLSVQNPQQESDLQVKNQVVNEESEESQELKPTTTPFPVKADEVEQENTNKPPVKKIIEEKVSPKLKEQTKNQEQKKVIPPLKNKEEPEKNRAVVSKQQPEKEKKESSEHFYTIQISSFKTEQSATEEINRLKKKGYSSYISVSDLPDIGKWYRVRIGKFTTKEDAEVSAIKIRNNERCTTYVTRSDN